jgi:hypothetical protein
MSSWPGSGCCSTLAAERLWYLQRDWLALQAGMVKCHAMLATLAPPVELQLCQDEGAEDIWGDQPSA